MIQTDNAAKKLNAAIRRPIQGFRPPEDLSLSDWSDKYRRLSAENSAEAGPWRTSRTPYLKEPMNAFTDPKVKRIVMVAASQVGKTELELNAIAYIIDQDPGSILYIHPTLEEAKKFSRQTVAPLIRDNKRLRDKVADIKARDSGNTILQKTFPGGVLTITGSNSPAALASTPIRYVIGDERDRWAVSAGAEGDPWGLAQARQRTFYNAKAIEVSTPTIKGASNIEDSYYLGTQERWCHKCPECGEYGEITFERIKAEHTSKKIRGKKVYKIIEPVYWVCPHCGCLIPEAVMRRQPAKWIAENPDAYKDGVRSFWLNAFSSPWITWGEIAKRFFDACEDKQRLKVVYNTLLGELWEDRDEVVDTDGLLSRREDYGTNEDGTPVELPDGMLMLTCGVDTQPNRLEYEVLGHGHHGETWGIRYGKILGDPNDVDVWERLDDIVDKVWKFRDGKGLKISITCVDSGGLNTTAVYKACKARRSKKVFAVKGRGGEYPFIVPASRVAIENNPKNLCWLYMLGVDEGKAYIMSAVDVQEPGPKYCHFPKGEIYGYDEAYFDGLLSERLELVETKSGKKWKWVKIPGHDRNEALDCRNYAMAGFRIIGADTFALEKKLKEIPEPKVRKTEPKKTRRKLSTEIYEDW